jgi:hypothetical protein
MENKMPLDLKQKIRADIHARLNPSWTKVFLKLAFIQFLSSFLVFAICPQFNLAFSEHTVLGHLFMQWGEFACNLACGAIFLGTGTMISLLVLSFDELRVLRLKNISSFSLLSLIALTIFMVLGVKFHLVMFTAWILGALVSSILSLEVYLVLRST